MSKNRMEAFSDGVIAIVITIMVLEMKVPHEAGAEWAALTAIWPVFLSYVLSFVFLGIYWNNHHHLLHASDRVTGKVLWANLHLLFWLSLIPFVTHFMGANHAEPLPTALYGFVLLMAAIAYTILLKTLLAGHGPESKLALAVGSDRKGKISTMLYVLAIPLAFVHQLIAIAIYVIVASIWLVPDRRIEARLTEP